ncbi:MAG: pyruvate ferredoxin oxidoreductase [Deltaproteobacteria bacterium]|nr:pyruvate ferredoxin oxidoreductase [Deltaproteobacteria bacterium]
MTTELLSANHAAAAAAALAGRANRVGRGFGGGVYPITPQSECMERLCDERFDKGQVVRVESEHSAMAVCIGFSIAGARAFTASSSNGLAYMTENVFTAAMSRLPIVMMAVNRSLGPPWNIWAEHGDTLMLRDAGWVQLYCEDNQEVLDSILTAFRLAEDRRVLLPVMVCQDAFILSHTMTPTDVPSQETVDAFLPPLDLPHRLSDRPRTVGALDGPRETEVPRAEMQRAMDDVPRVYAEVQGAFEATFGRRLADPVVPYRMDDAEIALVSIGTTAATVRAVVDEARARGVRVGGVRIRMFRPFPEDTLRQLLSRCTRVGVLDRDLAPGQGGIVWSEVRPAAPQGSIVQNYIVGLGGGDIRPKDVARILDDLCARERAGKPQFVEVG